MVFTIGTFWYLIVLAIAATVFIWYWSIRASHRIVERIADDDPERFNFRFKVHKPGHRRK